MINQLKELSRSHGHGDMTEEAYLAKVICILANKLVNVEPDDNDIHSLSAALEEMAE